MSSKLAKDKTRRAGASTRYSKKPMSSIRKIKWRQAAVQPLCRRNENLLATHIRGVLDTIAPHVCVQVHSAPEGFPKSLVLTTTTASLLSESPQMLETLRAERNIDRTTHSKRFHQWMRQQLCQFVGEEAALLYDKITNDLAIQIFTNELDEKVSGESTKKT